MASSAEVNTEPPQAKDAVGLDHADHPESHGIIPQDSSGVVNLPVPVLEDVPGPLPTPQCVRISTPVVQDTLGTQSAEPLSPKCLKIITSVVQNKKFNVSPTPQGVKITTPVHQATVSSKPTSSNVETTTPVLQNAPHKPDSAEAPTIVQLSNGKVLILQKCAGPPPVPPSQIKAIPIQVLPKPTPDGQIKPTFIIKPTEPSVSLKRSLDDQTGSNKRIKIDQNIQETKINRVAPKMPQNRPSNSMKSPVLSKKEGKITETKVSIPKKTCTNQRKVSKNCPRISTTKPKISKSSEKTKTPPNQPSNSTKSCVLLEQKDEIGEPKVSIPKKTYTNPRKLSQSQPVPDPGITKSPEKITTPSPETITTNPPEKITTNAPDKTTTNPPDKTTSTNVPEKKKPRNMECIPLEKILNTVEPSLLSKIEEYKRASLEAFYTIDHLHPPSVRHTEFICYMSLCKLTYSNKVALVNHLFTQHLNINQFKCYYCNFEALNTCLMRYHCSVAHQNEPPKYIEYFNARKIFSKNETTDIKLSLKCKFCSKNVDANAMESHLYMEHKNYARGKLVKCTAENYIMTLLDKHWHQEHRYQAPRVELRDCETKYKSFKELVQHVETHHLEQARCTLCNHDVISDQILKCERFCSTLWQVEEKFKVKQYVQSCGMKMYSKKYHCNVCYRVIGTGKELQAHILYQHYKFKKYRCMYCNLPSDHMQVLKTHIRAEHKKPLRTIESTQEGAWKTEVFRNIYLSNNNKCKEIINKKETQNVTSIQDSTAILNPARIEIRVYQKESNKKKSDQDFQNLPATISKVTSSSSSDPVLEKSTEINFECVNIDSMDVMQNEPDPPLDLNESFFFGDPLAVIKTEAGEDIFDQFDHCSTTENLLISLENTENISEYRDSMISSYKIEMAEDVSGDIEIKEEMLELTSGSEEVDTKPTLISQIPVENSGSNEKDIEYLSDIKDAKIVSENKIAKKTVAKTSLALEKIAGKNTTTISSKIPQNSVQIEVARTENNLILQTRAEEADKNDTNETSSASLNFINNLFLTSNSTPGEPSKPTRYEFNPEDQDLEAEQNNLEHYYYQCEVCNFFRRDRGQVFDHWKIKHEAKLIPQIHSIKLKELCKTCNTFFLNNEELEIHTEVLHSIKCRICLQNFESYLLVYQHYLKVHGHENWFEYCRMQSKDIVAFMTKYKRAANQVWRCYVCETEMFYSETALKEHLKFKHFGFPELQCTECPYFALDTERLSDHQETHLNAEIGVVKEPLIKNFIPTKYHIEMSQFLSERMQQHHEKMHPNEFFMLEEITYKNSCAQSQLVDYPQLMRHFETSHKLNFTCVICNAKINITEIAFKNSFEKWKKIKYPKKEIKSTKKR